MIKIRREIENLRIIAGILSIVLLSGLTGSALALQFATRKSRAPQLNSSLFLAIKAPPQSEQAAVNVLTAERVQELKTAEQASEDDRKLLHDEIFKMAKTENDHYTAIHEQLAVDEARLNSYTGVFGGGVTLLTAISIILQLFDRRRRRKTDFDEGEQHV